jgi:hypothetical protein
VKAIVPHGSSVSATITVAVLPSAITPAALAIEVTKTDMQNNFLITFLPFHIDVRLSC